MDRWGSLNTSTGFIQEEALLRGVSSQRQISTAAYRLGVDIGNFFSRIKNCSGKLEEMDAQPASPNPHRSPR
jgi:hypothetical protein